MPEQVLAGFERCLVHPKSPQIICRMVAATRNISMWILLLLACLVVELVAGGVRTKESPAVIRAKLHELSSTGRMNDVIEYLNKVEKAYGTLLVDDSLPSLYSYQGVALYNALRVQDAEEAFKTGLKHFPNDTRSWINLGELQVQTFKLTEAYNSFHAALQAGDLSALPRAVRTKGWSASWEHFEALTYALEREIRTCIDSMQECRIDSSGGMEYCDVDGRAHVLMNSLNPNSQVAAVQVPSNAIATYWQTEGPALATATVDPGKSIFQFTMPKGSSSNNLATLDKSAGQMKNKRLKVGFMSADFGVHPVAQLVRGLFQFINTSRVEVFCFSLQPKVSWWGQNISDTVEHFVWLQGMNTLDAAKEVARLGVEVLIDLNGHTMHSGLTIMTHQPAPLQMSFLGLPSTTASPFIDYYIGDSVAMPPEQQHHYSEQLVLMSDCYIANDYAQIQGDVLRFTGPNRAPREALKSKEDLSHASFLFGTLSNSQKMDPAIFQVWANILRRFAGSQMVIVEHAGSGIYMPNLQRNAESFGIAARRLVGLKQAPWIDHLYAKTSFDLMLDTVTKNGHTTGLDGVWAGVPTVSLAGGQDAQARAAESIAVSLESTLGLAYSLKEYEDLAFALARRARKGGKRGDRASHTRRATTSHQPDHPHAQAAGDAEDPGERRLRLWRQQVDHLRTHSNLFDMPRYEQQFSRLLQGTWELAHLAKSRTAFQRTGVAKGLVTGKQRAVRLGGKYNPKKLFHIFATVSNRYDSRDDALGERAVDLHAADVAASRLKNRDAQGRLLVSQSLSEGSMIAEAVRALDLAQGKELPAPSSNPASKDSNPTSDEVLQRREDKAGPEDRSTAATAASGRSGHEYHQTGRGAAGRSSPSSSAGEGTEYSGGGRKEYPPIPDYVFDGRLIMLNIGGLKPEEGWLTVNSQSHGNIARAHQVDIVREMHDLYGLPNNSVSAVYSSHTLEHNSFGDGALEHTLAEWYRVLRPGGLLLLSVPNLETLARMFLDPAFDLQEQWLVVRMMYGAQTDAFDYHMVGFNYNLLHTFLKQAGFCDIERVRSFNMFQDTSELVHKGYFISLNVAAKVCPTPPLPGQRPLKPDDGFSVDHQASPWLGDD